VQVPINQWTGLLVYLSAIIGISLLGTELSSLWRTKRLALLCRT